MRDFNTSLLEANSNYLKKIDAADANTTYIGIAEHGTATTTALWKIQKISTSGNVTTISWADGEDAFKKIWDNRASYSY